MEAKLIVVAGKANKAEVPLSLPATIGRGRESHLTIAHPTVSRRHCLVYELDGVLMVQDKGSLNGTFIDGERVDADRILRPGQTLTIGPLAFRAEYELADSSHDVLGDALEGASDGALDGAPADMGASELPEASVGFAEPAEAPPAEFLPPPVEAPETIHFASDGLNETTDLPPGPMASSEAAAPMPAEAVPADEDSGEFALPVDVEPESESGQFDFLDDEPIGDAAPVEPSGLSGGDSLSGGESGEIFSFADEPPAADEAKPPENTAEKKSKSSANGESHKSPSKASANGDSHRSDEEPPQVKVGSKPAAVHQSDDELNSFFESLGLD